MAGCCLTFSRIVCDSILAVVRALIFISCVVILIGQIARLWMLTPSHNPLVERFPEYFSLTANFVGGIGMCLLAIIGAYGAYKDPKWLKLFSLLIAILAVFSFLTIYTTNPSVNQRIRVVAKELEKMQREFQWQLKPAEDENDATRIWNFLQSELHCCGLRRPQDWHYGPAPKPDELPDSCCSLGRWRPGPLPPPDHKCHIPDAFRSGCLLRLHQLASNSLWPSLVTGLFYMLLAAMGLLVAKRYEPVAPPYGLNSIQPESHLHSDLYYRRYGSVYVRRWPLPPPPAPEGPNQMVNGYGSNNKTIYPNLSGLDRGPPPSYHDAH